MDIISSRTFDVPSMALYDAFAQPKCLARWWGPQGFTNTFHTFDFVPGGAWVFTMVGPDGTTYEVTKEFVEIVPRERVVLRQVSPLHRFLMTMTFAQQGRGSRLIWRMTFEPDEQNKRVGEIICNANEENFDRLAALLRMKPPAAG
jgi:uncharacterized protein YndB with AHSA1/START domain